MMRRCSFRFLPAPGVRQNPLFLIEGNKIQSLGLRGIGTLNILPEKIFELHRVNGVNKFDFTKITIFAPLKVKDVLIIKINVIKRSKYIWKINLP